MAIDIICLIFLAYGFWIGYSKGIISTVLSLTSYVFGVLAAMKFGPILGDMIFGWAPALTSVGSFIIGVVAVFVMTLVLFRIVAKGLTSFMEGSPFGNKAKTSTPSSATSTINPSTPWTACATMWRRVRVTPFLTWRSKV